MVSPDLSPVVVLDTNAVLDWLVFGDPTCDLLGAAIASGQVRWLATRDMLAELDAVLARDPLRCCYERSKRALTAALSLVKLAEFEAYPTPAQAPRCRDVDDQKFIELAVCVGASSLLTRDRALLELRDHAQHLGVSIRTPAQWASEHARP